MLTERVEALGTPWQTLLLSVELMQVNITAKGCSKCECPAGQTPPPKTRMSSPLRHENFYTFASIYIDFISIFHQACGLLLWSLWHHVGDPSFKAMANSVHCPLVGGCRVGHQPLCFLVVGCRLTFCSRHIKCGHVDRKSSDPPQTNGPCPVNTSFGFQR